MRAGFLGIFVVFASCESLQTRQKPDSNFIEESIQKNHGGAGEGSSIQALKFSAREPESHACIEKLQSDLGHYFRGVDEVITYIESKTSKLEILFDNTDINDALVQLKGLKSLKPSFTISSDEVMDRYPQADSMVPSNWSLSEIPKNRLLAQALCDNKVYQTEGGRFSRGLRTRYNLENSMKMLHERLVDFGRSTHYDLYTVKSGSKMELQLERIKTMAWDLVEKFEDLRSVPDKERVRRPHPYPKK